MILLGVYLENEQKCKIIFGSKLNIATTNVAEFLRHTKMVIIKSGRCTIVLHPGGSCYSLYVLCMQTDYFLCYSFPNMALICMAKYAK